MLPINEEDLKGWFHEDDVFIEDKGEDKGLPNTACSSLYIFVWWLRQPMQG